MAIYVMFIISFLVMIITVCIMIRIMLKRKQIFGMSDCNKYDVFVITDNKFIVLGGFVFTYNIDEIEKINFSVSKIKNGYIGKMRIFKISGKSRSFVFDSSCIKKKIAFVNTEKDIEDTIIYLQEKLKYSGIPNYKL